MSTHNDPREVLTKAAEIMRQDGGGYHSYVEEHRDKHYPPPAPAIVIPDAAIEAAGDGMYLMGWSDRREMLKAAAPLIIKANQKKPKAVGWVVVDKEGAVLSHSGSLPAGVLALVELSEVER